MKILKFDNKRCINFLNNNMNELDSLFWQELIFLTAELYSNAIRKAISIEQMKDKDKYTGNFKASRELVQRVTKEVDSLYDAILGQIGIEGIRDHLLNKK